MIRLILSVVRLQSLFKPVIAKKLKLVRFLGITDDSG